MVFENTTNKINSLSNAELVEIYFPITSGKVYNSKINRDKNLTTAEKEAILTEVKAANNHVENLSADTIEVMGKYFRINKPEGTVLSQVKLSAKQEYELQKINKAYSEIVFENQVLLGRSKIIHMAINKLLYDLEKLPTEEEAIQYLRGLYKESEF